MNTYQFEKKHLYTQKDRYEARKKFQSFENALHELALAMGPLTHAKLSQLQFDIGCLNLDIENEQHRRQLEYEPGVIVMI